MTCKAPLEPLWQVCPYCETPIVRRSAVYEETMALSPERAARAAPDAARAGAAAATSEDTAENLTGDQ